MKAYHLLIIGSALLSACTVSRHGGSTLFAKPFPIPPSPAPNAAATAGAVPSEDTAGGPRVNIISSGIYQGIHLSPGLYKQPGTTGHAHMMDSSRLAEATNVIPGRLGTSFGFKFAATGFPMGQFIPITIRIIHPPITRPASGRSTTVEQWQVPMAFHRRYTAMWSFREPWEIAPGSWTMQALHEGKVLAERQFTVLDLGALSPFRR